MEKKAIEELADIMKDIIVQLHREAGTSWCTDQLNKLNNVIVSLNQNTANDTPNP